jgi:signal transduction histidine kinase
MHDSIAAVRPKIERKGLTLTVEIPPSLAPILTDRDRLGQVLDNLLSNAWKYTPAPGSIAISAQAIHHIEELNGSTPPSLRCPCILVTIQDTGIGISRVEQRRVFNRFFRSDHPLVREETGTGLGLYLVHLLVERLGGQVWLESEPGRGSKFYVALPLTEAG